MQDNAEAHMMNFRRTVVFFLIFLLALFAHDLAVAYSEEFFWLFTSCAWFLALVLMYFDVQDRREARKWFKEREREAGIEERKP